MIKEKILKVVTVTVIILFFLTSGSDMYPTAYGDIYSEISEKKQSEEIRRLSDYYKKNSDTLRLMTYNILADSLGFEGSPAETRSKGICDILNGISPDVCGFQEVSRNWFVCISDDSDYKFINPVRTVLFEPMTALTYNSRTVCLISFGDRVFESGNNSRLRRMVWGIFIHKKTGKTFGVVNTHFSLSSEKSLSNTSPLTQALELIVFCKELKEHFDCPIFALGDFNAKESTRSSQSPIYNILCTVFHNTADLTEAVSHGENGNHKTNSIDHIFSFGNEKITLYVTLSQSSLTALSDHYPIFCDAIL